MKDGDVMEWRFNVQHPGRSADFSPLVIQLNTD